MFFKFKKRKIFHISVFLAVTEKKELFLRLREIKFFNSAPESFSIFYETCFTPVFRYSPGVIPRYFL